MTLCLAPLLITHAFLAGPADDDALLAPVQLEANGKPIDITQTGTAYAGPLVHDVDGDGTHDLIVTSIRGNFRHFRNVGSNAEPEYEDQGLLKIGDNELRLHNW